MMRWAIAAAVGALVAASTPVFGQQQSPPEIVGVRVGFAGYYKPGLWTPVEVFLRGDRFPTTCQLVLTAPDGDGVPCRVSTPAEPGREAPVLAYVRFGRTESSLAVELREGNRVIAQKVFEAGAVGPESQFPKALPSSERLMVVAGSDLMGVEEAVGVLRRQAGERASVVQLEDGWPGTDHSNSSGQTGGYRFDFRQMPTRWCGYEGVEAVILSTSRPEVYRHLKSDSPQIVALNQWVHLGGTLVLSMGRNAEELLREGGPLRPFLPGKFQRAITLRQSNALESYCGSPVAISRSVGGKLELRVPQLAEVQGTVEAREGNLPLVIRRRAGFGQVVFAAVDLDVAPVSQWPGRTLLVQKLLGVSESRVQETPQSSTVMHFGFDDLAGQLRSALDQFAGIPAVSFWLVVVIFIGYLALVGPVDYFLLRKVLRRMELTWLTFPPVVLAFSIGAYVAAHRLKGDEIRVNQVDLVDVDVESGRARGTSWANLFSPQTERFNVSFQPNEAGWQPAPRQPAPRQPAPRQPAPRQTAPQQPDPSLGPAHSDLLVSWFGLPGSGLGGMAPKTAGPISWEQPYEIAPELDRLVGVPVQVWSTKSLCARWTARVEPRVEAELTEQSHTPVGTVTNRLEFPLADCLLVYGRWVYDLGTIGPGESKSISSTYDRRDLRSFLSGRRMFEEDDKTRGRYDQSSVDVNYILRAMTFFEAAGGFRYTGLSNRYQGFVDLSDALKANRAVLVASAQADDPQSPVHGATWLCDGKAIGGPHDRHATMYRFVFPVQRPTAGSE